MVEEARGESRRNAAATDAAGWFRTIFEHSNDAILVVHPQADAILDANPRACRMLGYAREELLRLRISNIHPAEMAEFRTFARAVVETGSGWTNELRCLTRSGAVLPAEISASVIQRDGQSCVIAMVRDISERKRAEVELEKYRESLDRLVAERTAELRRSEQRQRALLGVSNALVANLDRQALFDAFARAVKEAIAFDRASLTLYEPGRDVSRVYALAGGSVARAFPVGAELPRVGTHLQTVLDERRPVVCRDLAAARRSPTEDVLLREGLRSYVAAPLVAKGRVLGALEIGSQAPDRYSDDDATFVGEIAGQIATAVDNMLAYEEIARLKAQLEQENVYLQEEIKTNFEHIVGQSQAMRRVLKAVETVAPTDACVLILGETGTGKELVARAVHDLSARRRKALVKVNCAAIPVGLFESELFGHEKGAFTGALARRIGRFELADGGTIFLDEIGELPLDLQAKLLRVLQEGEFERVGGATIRTDVRVIAATNRDLEKAMAEGRFRADLFYRLNVFPIQIPPLRERPEDVPPLARYFVARYGRQLGKVIETIPQPVMERLASYRWPGNARELENVIERAVIMSSGPRLELGEWVSAPGPAPEEGRAQTLEELERNHILGMLERTAWRVSGPRGAAKLLGLKPTTLEARMKRLGIKRKA
ncbi:MAG: sigma 54-interacting transcriptional regulator [Candidatus Rokuibacteriota bacterium]